MQPIRHRSPVSVLSGTALPVTVWLLAAWLAGCSSMYYSTMEAFGYAKRELLVDRVSDARESQQEAQEEFKSTYEALRSLTGVSGGELEERYEDLAAEYQRSKSAATDVTRRIAAVEDVSQAMFTEWAEEIEQIQNPALRQQSVELKRSTEQRYAGLLESMRNAEGRMQPVLAAFQDQVLFLKHNLNAQAIASLREVAVEIGSDVDALIAQMQEAITAADEFIATMQPVGSDGG